MAKKTEAKAKAEAEKVEPKPEPILSELSLKPKDRMKARQLRNEKAKAVRIRQLMRAEPVVRDLVAEIEQLKAQISKGKKE